MIRLRKKSEEKEFFRIDLAPMINIVFLLLIFFLLSSTAIKQGNKIDLPQAESSQKNQEKSIVISLNKNHQIQLDREEISMEVLLDKLTLRLQDQGKKVVTIEGDKRIVFEQLGEVLDIARQAGAMEFILGTEPIN